jgi:cardiolipin synthase
MTLNHYIGPALRGAYPVRTGNRVTPLVDGHHAFSAICDAVERAQKRVWVTVAFIDLHAEMPGGRGTFFQVLDGAAHRGVDVRALFWRLPEWSEGHLHYTGEQRSWFDAQGFRFAARWDWLPKMYCQHQKSWIVDAADGRTTAFIGGINLDQPSISAVRGHDTLGVHDVYVAVEGPSATDAVHNFVQRWNGASERHKPGGLWPDVERAGDLSYPSSVDAPAGTTRVQIARTIRRGQGYTEYPAPGVDSHPVADGEHGILEQYVNAISAARRTIYIEDQSLASASVIKPLIDALERGVDVVVVAPLPANDMFARGRREHPDAELYRLLDRLDDFDNFTFAGLSVSRGSNVYEDIYVHAKIMLVDDQWTTIGSCNIADRSFFGDSELNATFWDEAVTRKLRCDLMAEHLGEDLKAVDDVEGLRRFREVAKRNASQRQQGRAMDGLAFQLSTRTYGVT